MACSCFSIFRMLAPGDSSEDPNLLGCCSQVLFRWPTQPSSHPSWWKTGLTGRREYCSVRSEHARRSAIQGIDWIKVKADEVRREIYAGDVNVRDSIDNRTATAFGVGDAGLDCKGQDGDQGSRSME